MKHFKRVVVKKFDKIRYMRVRDLISKLDFYENHVINLTMFSKKFKPYGQIILDKIIEKDKVAMLIIDKTSIVIENCPIYYVYADESCYLILKIRSCFEWGSSFYTRLGHYVFESGKDFDFFDENIHSLLPLSVKTEYTGEFVFLHIMPKNFYIKLFEHQAVI